MYKVLGIVVALGLAAAAAWYFTGPGSQEGKVCARLETICGEAVMPANACRENLEGSSDVDLEALEACVEPAESCLEVTGCLVGSAARDLVKGAARGLLQ